jgi:uncharacterized oligopeptide transporter (OPT) family protein
MWGSGLTHGLWMVVGWVLGLLAVAVAVYVGVRLATRRMIGQLIHHLHDVHGWKEATHDRREEDRISNDR